MNVNIRLFYTFQVVGDVGHFTRCCILVLFVGLTIDVYIFVFGYVGGCGIVVVAIVTRILAIEGLNVAQVRTVSASRCRLHSSRHGEWRLPQLEQNMSGSSFTSVLHVVCY